jgi:hypothetical protein
MGALSIYYRLPDLKRMPFESSARWVAAYDLLSISVCRCQSPIPESFRHAETPSGEERASIYLPENVRLSVDTAGTGDARLQREAVLRDPSLTSSGCGSCGAGAVGLWPCGEDCVGRSGRW